MKQSKKLLSLVLALVMMLGTFSVAASAGLVKDDVKYDAIDGAALTAEQVADLALDYVDSDIMYSINKGKPIDLSVLGEIRTDTIDHILADIVDLRGSFAWSIGNGLIGKVGDLKFDPLKKSGSWGTLGIGATAKAYSRSDGDLTLVNALINFIGCTDNADILKKAAYGIGTKNGIDLGLIESFMGDDLDDINEYLEDLPGLLAKTVYDELVYGSYGYPDKSKNMTALPAEVNTVDKALNVAVNNLLSQPQDYKWEGEGDDKEKVWNMNSIVSRKFAADSSLKIDLNSDSVLGVVDKLFNAAVDEFGPTYLNNDVKKLLMEAVGVDFVRLDDVKDAALIKTITSDSKYVNVAGSGVRDNAAATVSDTLASVQNYLCDAQLWKVGENWYFRDYQKVTQKDADGNAILDENGNEVRVKQDRFFKADLSGANEFYYLINWDYKVEAGFITKEDTIDVYGSLFGSLNHILWKILDTAVNKNTATGGISASELETLWVDGGNDQLNANILRVAKYILVNYTRRVFGKSSEYVDQATGKATEAFKAKVNNSSLIGLVEYIGLPMFDDAMPQLILPSDGLESVADNQKLFAFGAAILREFMTQIAAERNYDSYIFTNINGDRKFVTHTSEEWLNIILNMGMDIAYEYTNKALVNFVDNEWPAVGVTKDRWQGMLNKLLAWAIDYIGDSSTSVLVGFEGSKFDAYTDPLDKLSYAFNTLLPLGFVSGCSSESFALDFNVLLNDVLVPVIEELNIAKLVSLFGRDHSESKDGVYNILTDKNAVSMILDLANRILKLVFGVDLLNTTNCNTALSQANVETLIYNLLTSLNTRKEAILVNALPVVAQFYSEWGGEQEIDTPALDLKEVVSLSGGAATGLSFTFKNGSTGVWRHYKDAAGNEYQDNQYKYQVKSVAVKDINNNTVSQVSNIVIPTVAQDFGETGTVTYDVSGVTSPGMVARFDINYVVYDEDGALMADGAEFTVSKYVYLNYNPTTTGFNYDTGKEGAQDCRVRIYYDFFVGYNPENDFADQMSKVAAGYVSKDSGLGSKTVKFQPQNNATQNGITYPSVSQKTSSSVSQTGYFAVADLATATAFASVQGNSITWSVDGYANSASSVHDKTKHVPVKMTFYDAVGYSNVKDLVATEVKRMRKAADYETGDVLANKLLTTTDSTDKNNKKVLKESNFTTTGTNEDGETVTKINGTTAWNTYVEAFNNAVRAAYQLWNNESVFNHQEAYEKLKVAAADLEYCKIDETKVTASAGAEKDKYAIALQNAIVEAEESLGGKSFYDYKMYRWSRYESARKDARNLVAAYTNQNYNAAETLYFTYRSDYKVSDINAMLESSGLSAAYVKYIKALYVAYDEDEVKANAEALAKAKNNYAGISVLDYANATNLVTRTAARLLDRDSYTKTVHLKNEYDSAVACVGTTNTKNYSEKSWARYEAALTAAKAILDKGSILCDEIFDAKYELQVARNQLKTAAEEADATELETLIAQAQSVLANASLYANSDKEFGELLAALGLETRFTDKSGNTNVDLFPSGALNVVNKSYDADNTKKYDRAANALREALAKIKYANTSVAGAVDTKVGEEDDGTAITVKTFAIPQKLTAAQAATKVSVAGAESVVSANGTYALAGDDTAAYTGTGATLTLVKAVNGVKTPIYTVNLIVKGDVNGDGVVDAIDATLVDLAAAGRKEFTGLYFAAANMAGGEKIDADDFQQVINLAAAG